VQSKFYIYNHTPIIKSTRVR